MIPLAVAWSNHAHEADFRYNYWERPLPISLQNMKDVQKMAENILIQHYPDISWKITHVRQKPEYPEILLDIEGFDYQTDRPWSIGRNRI